jgi:hypothetical protein
MGHPTVGQRPIIDGLANMAFMTIMDGLANHSNINHTTIEDGLANMIPPALAIGWPT